MPAEIKQTIFHILKLLEKIQNFVSNIYFGMLHKGMVLKINDLGKKSQHKMFKIDWKTIKIKLIWSA